MSVEKKNTSLIYLLLAISFHCHYQLTIWSKEETMTCLVFSYKKFTNDWIAIKRFRPNFKFPSVKLLLGNFITQDRLVFELRTIKTTKIFVFISTLSTLVSLMFVVETIEVNKKATFWQTEHFHLKGLRVFIISSTLSIILNYPKWKHTTCLK